MSHTQRTGNSLPLLVELAAPAALPILPEQSRPQPSEREIFDWHVAVLRRTVERMVQGDLEAQTWVNRMDLDDPMSFMNLCRFFQVDPYRMQERIEEWVAVRRRETMKKRGRSP